jgi:hypothetical protein
LFPHICQCRTDGSLKPKRTNPAFNFVLQLVGGAASPSSGSHVTVFDLVALSHIDEHSHDRCPGGRRRDVRRPRLLAIQLSRRFFRRNDFGLKRIEPR